MADKKYLKIVNGDVKSFTSYGSFVRTYYDKGSSVKAVRADWEDYDNGSVCILLENGTNLILSGSGGFIRKF